MMLKLKTLKDLALLFLIMLLITSLIWLPHIFKLPSFLGLNFSHGFSTIYQNFDGLNYIVVAKSLYDPVKILSLQQTLSPSYFPAHFPGYPLLILAFSPFLGFLKAMLFVSMIFTFLSVGFFYWYIKTESLTSNPLWLSVIFLLLPGRWLIVHSVGSPEPVFIFFMLVAIYFFGQYLRKLQSSYLWYCAIAGAFCQLVRPPGILLFIGLTLYLFILNYQKYRFKNLGSIVFHSLPLWLIPLTLIGVFWLYKIQTNDFFAFFHSGDNIHLTLPPFAVFNKHQFWVGDIWLEDIVYITLIGVFGGISLLRSKVPFAGSFVLTYILATIFVAHRDISRYIMPIFPFILISFEKVIAKTEFKIAIAFIILGIYLYAQNFLIENIFPVESLSPFL